MENLNEQNFHLFDKRNGKASLCVSADLSNTSRKFPMAYCGCESTQNTLKSPLMAHLYHELAILPDVPMWQRNPMEKFLQCLPTPCSFSQAARSGSLDFRSQHWHTFSRETLCSCSFQVRISQEARRVPWNQKPFRLSKAVFVCRMTQSLLLFFIDVYYSHV